MKFIDTIDIQVEAGAGGAGLISFMRARGKPKMGPDGGNGGLGGHVTFEGHSGLNTLYHLSSGRVYKAEDGIKGGSNHKTGRNGENLVIPVPLGTTIFDSQTKQFLGEVTKIGEQLMIAKGGKRGYGNAGYKNSTRQTPQIALPGEKGEKKSLSLELKVLAQVGFAGFPNAGKSTLLSVISDAQPKIADYPFTTLTPMLGVVDLSQYGFTPGDTLVFADIPGLIEGASEGKGLGHQFLRHLERTSLIIHMIALDEEKSSEDLFDNYLKLDYELNQYSVLLSHKPKAVVLSKADLINKETALKHQEYFLSKGLSTKVLSAATGEGISDFIRHMQNRLKQLETTQVNLEGQAPL